MKNKKLFAILTLVCFMMTLMPVAAFAAVGDADPGTSAMTLVNNAPTNLRPASSITGVTTTSLEFTLRDNGSQPATRVNGVVYVWAVDKDGAKTSALNVESNATDAAGIKYVYQVTNTANPVVVSFARTGNYTVYAGIGAANASSLADITKLTGEDAVEISVNSNTNPDGYTLTAIAGPGSSLTRPAGVTKDYSAYISNVVPNNVSNEYTLTFMSGANVLANKNVKIEAGSANITVAQKKDRTNLNGEVKFDLAASREGVYSILVTIDNRIFEIYVNSTNTSAAYIETEDQPEKAIAQFETSAGVSFRVTDINGNVVVGEGTPVATLPAGQGADGLLGNIQGVQASKYLFFVEKPAKSALTNADLGLVWNSADQVYDLTTGTLDAEGTYTVKVILDNGSVATATWEVKAFVTPVSMYISAGVPAQVELGRSMVPIVKYVDVNGTEKTATAGIELTQTGYAIQEVDGTYMGTATPTQGTPYTIVLKTDEKYVGSEVTVTAVSPLYNLVATSTAKIVDATQICFKQDKLAVNVNNKIDWFIADADGKLVRVNNVTEGRTSYVVLDKPEGAKVSIYETKRFSNSEGQFALTSDKVGNVTVQAICQVQLRENTTTTTNQTKYYTGTKIFAVGTEGVGDVVVMSIGSNEIVINDKTGVIDAAPMIQNNRTFVPFRALAEAFGAEVAYDEATQAVTASLNGVEVVMTIGSATYTVNGVEATMDVAPFIASDRTYVPVRFAAEAFGIKVIPTYNPDGTTADILFNL